MVVQVNVRAFRHEDVPRLFEMMKALSDFEGYKLEISVDDLIRDGLGDRPTFGVLVAERCGTSDLMGMAVYYTIPFTYHGRPNMVLKELFVQQESRGLGVGTRLFTALCNLARERNCKQLLWTVVPWNYTAKKFYAKHGGQVENQWESWLIPDLHESA